MKSVAQFVSLGAAILVSVLASMPAAALLLGTSVTGTLTFGGGGPNFFNSSNGLVPAGCQSSGLGSATVTIVNPTAEFCFIDDINTDTANFTDSGLTVSDVSGGGAIPFQMNFALAPGLITSVSELSDNFPGTGISVSLSSNLLTLNFAGAGGPLSGSARCV